MVDARRARLAAASVARDRRRWYCPRLMCDGLPHDGWPHNHARWKQHPPAWPFFEWGLIGGRRFGKTRGMGEAFRLWGEEAPRHFGIIGRKIGNVRELCFDGPSGLRSLIPRELHRRYVRSTESGQLLLELTNGTQYRGFSAETPDVIRGYGLDGIWADEFGAWPPTVAQDAYDAMVFCLADSPFGRIGYSMTPKALPHVRRLFERSRKQPQQTVLVTGTTEENRANLDSRILDTITAQYEGTRIGRQELGGVLLEDVEGALWQLHMFEADGFRLLPNQVPQLQRRVLAVDPALTSTGLSDHTALTVAGLDAGYGLDAFDARSHGYVLHAEEMQAKPEAVMRRVASVFWRFKCDEVVFESNAGGEYLPTVLQMVDLRVPWRLVHAKDGKRTRAQPISALYEQGRVHHVGPASMFVRLEEQMTTWTADPKEDSPDLMDSAVWALWALFIDPRRAVHSAAVRDERLVGRR